MIKFSDRGLNGASIISSDGIYEFDGVFHKCIGEKLPVEYRHTLSLTEVDVISLLRQSSDYCEIYVDYGDSVQIFNVNSSVARLIQLIGSKGGYECVLSRDGSVDGIQFSQKIFIYHKTGVCLDVVEMIRGIL